MGDKPTERESLPFSFLHDVFEQSQCLVLIESAIVEMHIVPSAQFKLATLASGGHIDSRRR
jgi:hypothetical protein